MRTLLHFQRESCLFTQYLLHNFSNRTTYKLKKSNSSLKWCQKGHFVSLHFYSDQPFLKYLYATANLHHVYRLKCINTKSVLNDQNIKMFIQYNRTIVSEIILQKYFFDSVLSAFNNLL